MFIQLSVQRFHVFLQIFNEDCESPETYISILKAHVECLKRRADERVAKWSCEIRPCQRWHRMCPDFRPWVLYSISSTSFLYHIALM